MNISRAIRRLILPGLFDGNAAGPMPAERIIEEIRRARGEVKKK